MSDQLKIECEWLGGQMGSAVDRAFYANIGVAVGEDWLTELEDQEARTVRNRMRGCGYHLATWVAANWWRLRWEPETRNSSTDQDWWIAHSLASAGGGYVWPNVIFASDGDSVAIASRPRRKKAAIQPIRYLNELDFRITAAEFERAVDLFMNGVLSRMDAMGIKEDNLPTLWSEILQERGSVEATQWRRLEALCGYDPDEAPESLIKMLIEDDAHLGSEALEEVAAQGRHATPEVLQTIVDLANSTARPEIGGFRGRMPRLTSPKQYSTRLRPWKQGAELAQLARKEWGLGIEPITNVKLAELLDTSPAVFTDRAKSTTPMPIALQTGTNGDFDFYFHSSWSTSRRFAAGRLLGDHIYYSDGGRLIPATDAKTARQQFQRAFAQEFLCPFDALLEKIQTDQPDDEDIAEAAEHFEVSPLMVRTTLVNKGELDREVLTCGAA
jgi:hypothetical protein